MDRHRKRPVIGYLRWYPAKTKTPNAYSEGGFRGAGYEIRTRDFHLGKVTLYH